MMPETSAARRAWYNTVMQRRIGLFASLMLVLSFTARAEAARNAGAPPALGDCGTLVDKMSECLRALEDDVIFDACTE